jgi:hypothetical protein
MKLNKQYLDELEESNYFGGLDGETEVEITHVREAWVEAMHVHGFALGCEIEFDDRFFDSASRGSIRIACDKVFPSKSRMHN